MKKISSFPLPDSCMHRTPWPSVPSTQSVNKTTSKEINAFLKSYFIVNCAARSKVF